MLHSVVYFKCLSFIISKDIIEFNTTKIKDMNNINDRVYGYRSSDGVLLPNAAHTNRTNFYKWKLWPLVVRFQRFSKMWNYNMKTIFSESLLWSQIDLLFLFLNHCQEVVNLPNNDNFFINPEKRNFKDLKAHSCYAHWLWTTFLAIFWRQALRIAVNEFLGFVCFTLILRLWKFDSPNVSTWLA